ncbi:MAG: hypothetical protein RSG52_13720 [Terrisporobacter sp.]|uniref:hypothetical protein n=1 Tax=Terrisporobacter sp. TaxID=1965305 RepID=UPI002FCA5C87
MTKTKKIVLFIVEGITDEMSLSLILSKLVADSRVQFHIINQDITADFNSNCQNIIRKIHGEVKKFLLQNNGLRKTDIKEIIHLVDTDGTFIEGNSVIEDINYKKTFYDSNCIKTNKRDLILSRNERKSSILNKLYQTNDVGGIPYRVYFFSCNLEHVLHNSPNTFFDRKSSYSYDFVDKYVGKEKEFVSFLSDNSFTVKGDYKNTWQFIKEDTNSLNRHCNFHLFFKK